GGGEGGGRGRPSAYRRQPPRRPFSDTACRRRGRASHRPPACHRISPHSRGGPRARSGSSGVRQSRHRQRGLGVAIRVVTLSRPVQRLGLAGGVGGAPARLAGGGVLGPSPFPPLPLRAPRVARVRPLALPPSRRLSLHVS